MNPTIRTILKRLVPARVRQAVRGRSGRAAPHAISEIAQQVSEARLTYLSRERLANIEAAVADVNRRNVPGAVLECGIALGGSAIVLARLMSAGRAFHGYDVFGMIPAPGALDDEKSKERYEVIRSGKSKGIRGDPYYGYVDDLYDRVAASFATFGVPVDGTRVSLHKGLFEDTLHPSAPIAFAHIDCDWYDPVKLCLTRIYPRLSPGGYVVLDDYNDYGGCRRATDEFLATVSDVEIVSRTSNVVLRKRRS